MPKTRCFDRWRARGTGPTRITTWAASWNSTAYLTVNLSANVIADGVRRIIKTNDSRDAALRICGFPGDNRIVKRASRDAANLTSNTELSATTNGLSLDVSRVDLFRDVAAINPTRATGVSTFTATAATCRRKWLFTPRIIWQGCPSRGQYRHDFVSYAFWNWNNWWITIFHWRWPRRSDDRDAAMISTMCRTFSKIIVTDMDYKKQEGKLCSESICIRTYEGDKKEIKV